jgi:hypothetical protein
MSSTVKVLEMANRKRKGQISWEAFLGCRTTMRCCNKRPMGIPSGSTSDGPKTNSFEDYALSRRQPKKSLCGSSRLMITDLRVWFPGSASSNSMEDQSRWTSPHSQIIDARIQDTRLPELGSARQRPTALRIAPAPEAVF